MRSLSSWFHTYAFAEVLDGLLVGAYPLDEQDVGMLRALGVERVLNLAEDSEYQPAEREAVEYALAAAQIEERRVPLIDYGDVPEEDLDVAVRRVNDWLDEGLRVYLHCRAGWQRAPIVAAAVLATRAGIDVDEALAQVKARKQSADPLPHQLDDARRWWARRAARGAGA